MSNRAGEIGKRIRAGIQCQVCREKKAVEYWRKQYICDECLNPPPTEEYYKEQRELLCDAKSSFVMIPMSD
jgi:Zn ribbon nucleic-acid-binding protein